MKKAFSQLILYSGSRILLQHRTDDAPVSPGLWGFFGGSCEGNEEAEETLKREILEELGYMTTCVNLFHIQEFT